MRGGVRKCLEVIAKADIELARRGRRSLRPLSTMDFWFGLVGLWTGWAGVWFGRAGHWFGRAGLFKFRPFGVLGEKAIEIVMDFLAEPKVEIVKVGHGSTPDFIPPNLLPKPGTADHLIDLRGTATLNSPAFCRHHHQGADRCSD